ncbi:Uncharacterised protein [Enterobacter cloacae]|uniref:Uncharacterized protein n=1 Tax=Enterobacter cloacae TaxID=550 RepID=A0A377LZG6_ENTCL|nr:Uncharacterised protein [Enterobacter cloacae]
MAFQGRQLLADFIVGFQIGELLIERFLLTDAVAFRFRFHLIDTTFEGLKTRHCFIKLTAVQLTAYIAGRVCRLVTQRKCLLTRTGFAQLVLKLANLFLHTGERVVHQRNFMFQRGNHIRQFLFFNQCGTGQIFFIFTQRQFGFFLPFIKLGGSLLNTAG